MMDIWIQGKETWLLCGVMQADGREVGGSELSLEGWECITNSVVTCGRGGDMTPMARDLKSGGSSMKGNH